MGSPALRVVGADGVAEQHEQDDHRSAGGEVRALPLPFHRAASRQIAATSTLQKDRSGQRSWGQRDADRMFISSPSSGQKPADLGSSAALALRRERLITSFAGEHRGTLQIAQQLPLVSAAVGRLVDVARWLSSRRRGPSGHDLHELEIVVYPCRGQFIVHVAHGARPRRRVHEDGELVFGWVWESVGYVCSSVGSNVYECISRIFVF